MSVRGASLAAWAAAGALLGGCRFVGATDTNLRELHTEEGMHRRSARVTTHYGYATRVGLVGLLRSFGSKPQEASLQKVEDPLASCVEALNELAGYDSDDAWVRALQIEHFSRVAVYDPWKLSRAIAVEALGGLGAKLEPWAFAAEPEGVQYASVETLAPALQQLVRASNRLVRGAVDEVAADNAADPALGVDLNLAAASEALEKLTLDLEGAHRALRICSLLERTRLRSEPEFAAVRRLRAKLEQRCVGLALRSALSDAPPQDFERLGADPGWSKAEVQAAAVRACVRIWGDELLAELLTQARPRDDAPLRSIALLHEVERRGLPAAPVDASAEQAQRLQLAWTRRVWMLATDHPDGSVRVAGLGALGRISGKGRFSLREEDWLGWAGESGLLSAPAEAPAQTPAESPKAPEDSSSGAPTP